MKEESYTEDFNEDDDLYYEDLEYSDEYEYDDKYEPEEIDRYIETDNYDEYDDYDEYDEYEEKEKQEQNVEKEKKKEKHYYLKDSIKGIIFVVLVIILVIILLGFFKSSKSKNINKTDDNGIKVIKKLESVNNTDNTKVFNKMKKASLNYFTEEKVKEENSITLSKMKELSLIDSIDDKFDGDKSNATLKNNKLTIDLYTGDKKETKSYSVKNYIYCKDTYYCERSQELENKSYQYTKEGNKRLSDWSNWSEYEESSCDAVDISCEKDDMECLTEVRTDSKNITTQNNMVYQSSRNAFKTLEKEVKSMCNNYDYVKINGIYYRTEKNSNFKMVGAITKDTKATYYNWVYAGRKKFHVPPSDTITTRYVYVNEDYSNCGDTCSDHPDYYYDVYNFSKQLVQVNNTTSDCSNLVNRVVPNYVITQQKITVSRNEKQTSKVCYKSERARKINQDENIIKWSSYNDKSLLKDGYSYTGEYK